MARHILQPPDEEGTLTIGGELGVSGEGLVAQAFYRIRLTQRPHAETAA